MKKSTALRITVAAIEHRYAARYDDAIEDLRTRATEYAVEHSHHTEIAALIPFALEHVMSRNALLTQGRARCATASAWSSVFSKVERSIKMLYPVYGYFGDDVLPKGFDTGFIALSKEIDAEFIKLLGVVSAYRNTKALIAEVPALARFIPVEQPKNTQLSDINLIKSINEVYSV